jgi:hypothetical protein
MASFNLTAQLNISGPANLKPVISNIRKQLSSINPNINININTANLASSSKSLQDLNTNLKNITVSATSAADAMKRFGAAVGSVNMSSLPKNMSAATQQSQQLQQQQARTAKTIKESGDSMVDFGRQSALAIRRFAAFTLVTGIIYKFTSALSSASDEFMKFNKQMVQLSQVTGTSLPGLAGLEREITSLSTSLGVSSSSLIDVSSTLAQAGLSAQETEQALKALAKSTLAPSFDDLNSTVEGSIALMRQFSISTAELDGALGSINAVAAKFAVEAGDIITAIQRTGGVFAASSKGVAEGTEALNQFIAVFTSIRATTRESAETIATGLRTIFTRLQRRETIDTLKQFGVQLTDLEGKFVGPYEAVKRLSQGLAGLDTRDIRFSSIIEELGGFRQVGKVIPLLQQFATAEKALGVAQRGQGSLTADAAKAQQALAIQMTKVQEEFISLVRKIGSSNEFQTMVKLALNLASAFISVADSAKHALPAITALLAVKGTIGAFRFASGFMGGMRGGGGGRGAGDRMSGAPKGFAGGGQVPVALEAGELVFSGAETVKKYGGPTALSRFNRTGQRPRNLNLARGGGVFMVPGSGRGDNFKTTLPEGSFVIKRQSVRSAAANGGRIGYATGGEVQRFSEGTDKPIKVGKTNASGGVFMHLDPGPIIKNLFGPGSRKGRGLTNIGITLGGKAAKWNQELKHRNVDGTIGKANISKEELIAAIAGTDPEQLFSQQLQISRNGKGVRTGAGTFRGGRKSAAYAALSDPKVLHTLKNALIASANNLNYPIVSDKQLYPLGKSIIDAADNPALKRAFAQIKEVVYTDPKKGKERREKAALEAAKKGTKIRRTTSEVRKRWTEDMQDRAEKGDLRVVTQRGGRHRYHAIGGLIQRLSGGTDKPLAFPGRASLLKTLLTKFPDMRSIDALIGGEDARKVLGAKNPSGPSFQKLMAEYGKVAKAKTAKKEKEKRLASTREFGVLGLRGPSGTSQETTPLLKSKTKGTFKPKDVTVHKGVLSGFLSKRLEAIARKGYRETVAQMAAVLADRAGTPAVSDRKALNAIIKKTFQGGGLGQMFESAVAAADSRSFYPTGKINTPMDLPKGSGVAGLFGVKKGIATDVTVNTEEPKTAQMGRFLRDKKLRRSRKALGGQVQRLANAGKVSRSPRYLVPKDPTMSTGLLATNKPKKLGMSSYDKVLADLNAHPKERDDIARYLASGEYDPNSEETRKYIQERINQRNAKLSQKTNVSALTESLKTQPAITTENQRRIADEQRSILPDPQYAPPRSPFERPMGLLPGMRRLAVGGEVQRLSNAGGPLHNRKRSNKIGKITGLIDSDQLRKRLGESPKLREVFQKLGFHNPEKDTYNVDGYRDSLANAALEQRKKGGVDEISASLGSPGAGKSTLGLKGKGSKRYIETVEDIQEMIASGNRVVIRNAMASLNEEKVRHLSEYDRLHMLSSTTPAEMKELKGRLKNRTRQGEESVSATGVDTSTQFNRKHTIKAQSSEDTEAMLRLKDEKGKQIIDERKIVTHSIATGRRKGPDEVPTVERKPVRLVKGAFAPPTLEGHGNLFSHGDPKKTLLVNVGADESITEEDRQSILSGRSDAHGARSLLMDRKTRSRMVEKTLKDQGINGHVSTSGDGFVLPSMFKTGKGQYVQPDIENSVAVIGGDRIESADKYKQQGYKVDVVPRPEGGESGTAARARLSKGDFSGLSPSVQKMLMEAQQRNVFGNTQDILPKVIQHVEKKAQIKIAAIDQELDKLLASVPGGRLTKAFKEQNPEKAKEIEKLRGQKTDAKSWTKRSGLHALMGKLKRRYPERYRIGGDDEPSLMQQMADRGTIKPIRTVTGKRLQRAAIGGSIQRLANAGTVKSMPHPMSAQKPEKQFGKIGLRSSGKEITAFYFKNNTREGFVTANEIEKGIWNIGLSKATKGYGPRLYDAVMEAVTARGGVLTSHRGKVSGHAKKVWDVYSNERSKPDNKYGSQVTKVPLDPKHHTIDKDPNSSINHGYQQQPNIIKGPDIVDMNDKKYDKMLDHMKFEFLRANGGEIPIMAQEGEFVLNKHAAGQIGPHTLKKLNRGGRVAMNTLEKLPKYHSGGSVQKLKVGGIVGKSHNDLSSPLDALQNTSNKESLLDPSYQEQKDKKQERVLRSRARQKKRTERLRARQEEAANAGDIGAAFDFSSQIDETNKRETDFRKASEAKHSEQRTTAEANRDSVYYNSTKDNKKETAAEMRARLEAKGTVTHKSLDTVTTGASAPKPVVPKPGDPGFVGPVMPGVSEKRAKQQAVSLEKQREAAKKAGFSTEVGTSGTRVVNDSDLENFKKSRRQQKENERTPASNTTVLGASQDPIIKRQNRDVAKQTAAQQSRGPGAIPGFLGGAVGGAMSGASKGATVARGKNGGIVSTVVGGAIGGTAGLVGGAVKGALGSEKSNRIRSMQYGVAADKLRARAGDMAKGGSSSSGTLAVLNKAFAPLVSTASKLNSGMSSLHSGAAKAAQSLSSAGGGLAAYGNNVKNASGIMGKLYAATSPAINGLKKLGSSVVRGADSAIGSLGGMQKVNENGKQVWRNAPGGIMGRVGGFLGMGGGGGTMGDDGVTRGPDGKRKKGFGGGGRKGGGGGGMGGMGMYAAEMGLSMAGSAAVEQLAAATGGQKTKEGREISTIGGSAVSGASMGMMMGSMFGPMGMAAGAAIGGLGGAAYGYSQMPEIERQAASQKRMESIEKAGGKMSQNLAIANNAQAPESVRKEAEARAQADFETISSNSRAESVAGAKKKERTWAEWSVGADASSAKTVEERVESAQPAADKAKEMLSYKMQKTGKNLEELESSMPKAEFDKLTEAIALTDKGYQSLLESVHADGKVTDAEAATLERARKAAMEREGADIKAAGEAAKTAKQNASMTQAMQKVTTSFEKMATAITAAAGRADRVMENGKLGIEAVDNPMAAVQQGQISKSADILSNPEAYSMNEVEGALRQNASMAGSSSEAMVQSAMLPRKLEQDFGTAMQTAKAGGKDDAGTRDAVKKAMMGTVTQAFGPDIASGMSERINTFLNEFEGDIREVDFNDLVKKFPELANTVAASEKTFAALQKQSETASKAIGMIGDAAQKSAGKGQEIRNRDADTYSTVANSTLAFRRGTGEKISWQADAGVRNQARATRLGTSAQVAASPKAMLDRYNQLNKATGTAATAQQQITEANRPALLSGDQNQSSGAIKAMESAARTTAEFAQATQQARDEIMNLPNDIKENIGGIMQELQDVMQERAAKIGAAGGLMEKILTSTPKDLRKMGNTFNNLNQTLSGKGVSFEQSHSANTAYNQVRNQGGNHMQAQRAAQEAYAQESGDTLSMAKELAPLLGAVDPEAQNKMMGSVYENMFAARGMDTSKMMVGDKSMKDYIQMMKEGGKKDPKVEALQNALSAQQSALQAANDAAKQLIAQEAEALTTKTGAAVLDAMIQGAEAVRVAVAEGKQVGTTPPGEVGKPGAAQGKAPLGKNEADARIAENEGKIAEAQKTLNSGTATADEKEEAKRTMLAAQQENAVFKGDAKGRKNLSARADTMTYDDHKLEGETEEEFNKRKQKLHEMSVGTQPPPSTTPPQPKQATTAQAAANSQQAASPAPSIGQPAATGTSQSAPRVPRVIDNPDPNVVYAEHPITNAPDEFTTGNVPAATTQTEQSKKNLDTERESAEQTAKTATEAAMVGAKPVSATQQPQKVMSLKELKAQRSEDSKRLALKGAIGDYRKQAEAAPEGYTLDKTGQMTNKEFLADKEQQLSDMQERFDEKNPELAAKRKKNAEDSQRRAKMGKKNDEAQQPATPAEAVPLSEEALATEEEAISFFNPPTSQQPAQATGAQASANGQQASSPAPQTTASAPSTPAGTQAPTSAPSATGAQTTSTGQQTAAPVPQTNAPAPAATPDQQQQGPMSYNEIKQERRQQYEQSRYQKQQQYLGGLNEESRKRAEKQLKSSGQLLTDPTQNNQPPGTVPASTSSAAPQASAPMGAPVAAPRPPEASPQQNQGAGVLSNNGFEAFASKLDTLLTKLAEVNIPTEIRLTSEQLGVNITLNGAEVMNNLGPALASNVMKQAGEQLARYDQQTAGEGTARSPGVMGGQQVGQV